MFSDRRAFTYSRFSRSWEGAQHPKSPTRERNGAPEFLNRIDDVIVFDKLDDKSLKKIVQIELNILSERLTESNYEITFHKTVVDEIIKRNSEEEYGARPIKRIIQNLCEDFISDNILTGDITKEMGIILKIKEGNLEILKNTPLI